MWIDKQAYHWVKVQADVIEPVTFGFFLAKVNPGTRFELDQSPLGNVWLPRHFIQSVNASVLGLYGIRDQDEFFYSNYRENNSQLKIHSRPSLTSPVPLLRNVAMALFYRVARLLQALIYLICNEHRSVVSARASKRTMVK